MPNKRIFLTGASGCIGHYIADALIQETGYDLYLLVRDPKKLKFNYEARPGVTILKSDLRDIKNFADILATMDVAILAATSWGGQQETFDINVVKTLQLVKLLDPQVCQQILYFSTASILDNENQLLKQAGHFGTDYIRSKYDCYRQLEKLPDVPPITALYPTLVFGGDNNKPYSHISAGLPDILKWIDLVRFFKADGSFHFIHARDIATVVRYLVDSPPPLPEKKISAINHHLVLGNQRLTANQAVEEICHYLGKKIHFRIPLSLGLAELIINILRTFGVKIEISSWDWFCMRYRHFTYREAINPAIYGEPSYCPTLRDLLKITGIPEGETQPERTSTSTLRSIPLEDEEPPLIPPENHLPSPKTFIQDEEPPLIPPENHLPPPKTFIQHQAPTVRFEDTLPVITSSKLTYSPTDEASSLPGEETQPNAINSDEVVNSGIDESASITTEETLPIVITSSELSHSPTDEAFSLPVEDTPSETINSDEVVNSAVDESPSFAVSEAINSDEVVNSGIDESATIPIEDTLPIVTTSSELSYSPTDEVSSLPVEHAPSEAINSDEVVNSGIDESSTIPIEDTLPVVTTSSELSYSPTDEVSSLPSEDTSPESINSDEAVDESSSLPIESTPPEAINSDEVMNSAVDESATIPIEDTLPIVITSSELRHSPTDEVSSLPVEHAPSETINSAEGVDETPSLPVEEESQKSDYGA